MNSKISLIIPVYNECEVINNFFQDLKICNFSLINEIIFVNDYSNDNSLDLIQKKINEFEKLLPNVNFVIINNLKNRGYGFSIKKGVETSNNESIAIIDLDGTYKIEDLNNVAHEFINKYRCQYDLIIG